MNEYEIYIKAGLKINDMGNGRIFITSKYDEWYIDDNIDFITLYHKNKLKHRYHIQRRFRKIDYALNYICVHDGKYNYKSNVDNYRVISLIDKISKERHSKI